MRIIRVTFLSMLAVAVAGSICWAWDRWDEGAAARKKGDYDTAIAIWTEAISSGELSEDSRARVYYSRGLVWFHKGQNDKAITDYTKAIELNPRFVRAYYNRSYAYETQGRFRKAISDINRFIRLVPNDRNGPIRLDELNDKLKKRDSSKNYSSLWQHPWNRGSGHVNRLI